MAICVAKFQIPVPLPFRAQGIFTAPWASEVARGVPAGNREALARVRAHEGPGEAGLLRMDV